MNIREVNEMVCNEMIDKGCIISHRKGKDDFEMMFNMTNKNGKSIIFSEAIFHNLYGETSEIHHIQLKKFLKQLEIE